ASQYGADADALIDEEAGRSLTSANRIAQAALNARGFGQSTAAANQMAGNAAAIDRGARQDKLGVRQQTLDRQMQAGQYRTSLAAQRAAGLSALQGGMLADRLQGRLLPLQT